MANDFFSTFLMSVAADRDIEELKKAIAAQDAKHAVLYLLYLIRDIPDDELAYATTKSIAKFASCLYENSMNGMEPTKENLMKIFDESSKPLDDYILTHPIKKEETND